MITITLSFNTTTSVSAGELLKFSISNNTNPTTTQASSAFDFQIVNANNYDVNTYSGTLSLKTTEAAQLTAGTVSGSTTVPSVATILTFNITLAHSLPSTGVIFLYNPSEVDYDSLALSCLCTTSLSSVSN